MSGRLRKIKFSALKPSPDSSVTDISPMVTSMPIAIGSVGVPTSADSAVSNRSLMRSCGTAMTSVDTATTKPNSG